MDVKKMAKFCGEFGCETDISVRDDFAGNAVMWYHVTSVEKGNFFRVDRF
jgi:hypothetical protein